jgi:hypothetical protein
MGFRRAVNMSRSMCFFFKSKSETGIGEQSTATRNNFGRGADCLHPLPRGFKIGPSTTSSMVSYSTIDDDQASQVEEGGNAQRVWHC